MEKKIVIKLFEDFKNDISIAKTRSIEILDFIIKNYKHDFKHNREQSVIVGDYSISIEGVAKNGEWFDYSIGINRDTENFDEMLDIHYRVINHGGHLERPETQLQPDEYADDNYEFDLQEAYYSIYYDDNQSENDIDYFNISDLNDQTLDILLMKIGETFIHLI